MLEAAKRAYKNDSVAMNPTVEIEVTKGANKHGWGDHVKAGLQYGWNECGNETIYQN